MAPRVTLNLAPPKRDRSVAIVLVHGYGSRCATNFDYITRYFHYVGENVFDIYHADFETNASLKDLGAALGALLQDLERGYENVAILGYSMGGLVARMALLLTDLPKTKRLVTLAAPNQGVFGAAHLSRMTVMLANSGMGTHLLRRHARGVDDMRQAHKRFREVREVVGLPTLNSRLAGKTYITIPANFFHENQELSRAPSEKMTQASWAFNAANVVHSAIAGFFGAGSPAISLTRPHDGLVEMRSSRLMPMFGGSFSETQAVSPQPAPPDWNLAVLRGVACDDHDHVSVLRSMDVATLACAALFFATPNAAVDALHNSNVFATIDP